MTYTFVAGFEQLKTFINGCLVEGLTDTDRVEGQYWLNHIMHFWDPLNNWYEGGIFQCSLKSKANDIQIAQNRFKDIGRFLF